MKTPIIVDEHGSLIIFRTIYYAENYLEPIDVKNNEYIAYDSEGRLLKLLPTEPLITILDDESVPTHQEILKTKLMGFLVKTGLLQDNVIECSLEELVSRSLEYEITW